MATKKAAKKVVKKVVKKSAKPRVQVKPGVNIDYNVLAKHIAEELVKGRPVFDQECRVNFSGEPFCPVKKEYPPEETEDTNILNEAVDIVFGDRERMYGDPGKNIRAIAAYWTVHLQQKYGMPNVLTEDDVCQMMISVKQARLLHNPEHRDSQVDTAGYQAVMARIQRHLPF